MFAMRVNHINQLHYGNYFNHYGVNQANPITPSYYSELKTSAPADVFSKSADKISFNGKFVSYEFETKFTRTFFKKLAQEHIPDAYSDIDFLIPQENFDTLRLSGAFSKRGQLAVKLMEPYKGCLHKIEKEVFILLENLVKKHPNLNLQELLQLKYPSAEQTLIRQQSEIMDKLSLTARDILPNKEFQELRKVINQAFDKIFAQNPLPEDRFRRKDFLLQLKKLDISDAHTKNKLLTLAEELPHSSKSLNAFIVKYSQPYKVRWDEKSNSLIKLPRDSQEIGEKILGPSVNTDDHMYPQKAFKKEQEDRIKGEKYAKDLSTLRVTLLCSRKMNEEKSDILLDDFIKMKKNSIDIPAAIQRQIDKYIKTTEKWLRQGKIEDAKLLSEYIQILEEEYALRSKNVTIDTRELDRILPTLNNAYNAHIDKLQNKKLAKQKRNTSIKRNHGAANNHKDVYVGANGKIKENRKTQTHFSKFSH